MSPRPATVQLEAVYAEELGALAERARATLAGTYDGLDVHRLAAAFHAWLPAAAATVAAHQSQAQVLTAEFAGSYVESETGRAWRPAPVSSEIAGRQADGRTMLAALAGTTGAVWLAVKAGRSAEEAMIAGRALASSTASSAVWDAGWRELSHQANRQARALAGWYWQTRGDTCPACLAQQDGRVRPAGERMRRHPGCDCIAVPALAGGAYGRLTGAQLFDSWSPEQQAAIFRVDGAAAAEAIREGRATLADFAHTTRTARGPVTTSA